MPLYLVRWPGLSASLVRARNEDDLIAILDEVADPGGCTHTVYRGPVWIDFDIPVEVNLPERASGPGVAPVGVGEVEIGDVADLGAYHMFKVGVPDGDSAAEMLDQIIGLAFPATANVMANLDEAQDRRPEPNELRGALRRDLAPLLQHRWRHAQVARRTDPEATLMKILGVTRHVPGLTKKRTRDDDSNE
ncbi:MAG: hypothetical protein IT373_37170 [Polyangiaceae bacterium]|nr:hypothetical protein [Polyangiaceae bacterium]